MNKADFRKLFESALEIAASNAQTHLGAPVSRNFLISLEYTGYTGQVIDVETATNALFLGENIFFLIIDVGVKAVTEGGTVVFVRPSNHAPGPFEKTWNKPPGSGPFKQIFPTGTTPPAVQVTSRVETVQPLPLENLPAGRNTVWTEVVHVRLQEGIPALVQALKRIQTEGEPDENFVIFLADVQKNYYIQVAPESAASPYGGGKNSLYIEAVGNEFLETPYALQPAQIERFEPLGWQETPYSPNFFCTWQAANDDARLLLAREILKTFVDVYEIHPEQQLIIQVMIPAAN